MLWKAFDACTMHHDNCHVNYACSVDGAGDW